MAPIDRLCEIEALHRLKARYFRLYDTQDWNGWLSLFTEDATLRADHMVAWSGSGGMPTLELIGRQAIADHLVPLGPTRRTVHHGHTPEIDLLSATEATGIWAMEDIIDYADRRLHGHGHYHETYRKVDGAWRFATIHLTRLRLTTTAVSATGIPPLLAAS